MPRYPDIEFERRIQAVRLKNKKLSDLSEDEALTSEHLLASLQLKIESVGSISNDLQTWHNWIEAGQRRNGSYQGSTIRFGERVYRLPRIVQQIIEELREVTPESSVEDQTRALAAIKKSLKEYGGEVDEGQFLSSMSITFASAVSIKHSIHDGEVDFDPVLFGREEAEGSATGTRSISEDNAILSNYFAQTFSEQFRKYPEIKPTYLLQAGEYLLLDTGLQKVLKTVKHYQQQDNKTKMDFISNPGGCLREAHEDDESLSIEAGNEFDPSCTEHIFVETREYSERVNGMGIWVTPDIPGLVTPPNNWRPEAFSFLAKNAAGKEIVLVVPEGNMEDAKHQIENAITAGQATVMIGGQTVVPSEDLLTKIDSFIPEKPEIVRPENLVETPERKSAHGPFVLEGKNTLDTLEYLRDFASRPAPICSFQPTSKEDLKT